MRITHAHDVDKKQIVLDGCMVTASNLIIDLYDPDPELILIEDIAHGLAHTCRWNGHTQRFWSVAQHCCMAFDRAPEDEKLAYLFHDAEEAYWGDIIKPVKNKIKEKMPEIIFLMEEMRELILDKFSVPVVDTDSIDRELLQWEFENIIKSDAADFWLPDRAKTEWLSRYSTTRKGEG